MGAVHALSHPLGGLKSPSLHHGTLNALFLPPVIRFNAPVVGNKIERLAAVMGVRPDAGAVADAVAGLNGRLGLPANLKAMGVPVDILDAIAEMARKDHCHGTNPREASVADYRAILDQAYG